ncbi:MAG: glutathione S-transferase [Pseudomonadota bacterium]
MTAPADIILHNYPQSPVAEKVRVALGIKDADWLSVEIPRIPPKPDLIKLTGGYRRTPVMQIGADIYCDSQCILRELDRRRPTPPFQGPEAGLMWALSRWTDGALFDLAVKLVLGGAGDALPADFAEDRGRLYLGPDWAEGLRTASADLPHLAAQMRVLLSWLDDLLLSRSYIAGSLPGAIDAQVYHVVWFIRGRWDKGAVLLSEFEALARWEARIAAIGHGRVQALSAADAIEVAANAIPGHPKGVASGDPQGLAVGQSMVVTPDVNGGEQGVEGTIWSATTDTVTILRHDPDCGDICVHFPRSGYRIADI